MKYLERTGAFLIMCVLFVKPAYAQDYLKSFNQDLTPSPMVASLGTYGGIDVKKNSGGISKSINFFEVKQGDLAYSPSMQYFSVGIKVDDWGSRLGTGWTENITAVITRVVKGMADERASSRLGGTINEFGAPDFTTAAFNRVKSLAFVNPSIDGEYDIFSYNLFGLSGEFIIRNNQAVLFSPHDNLKIDIVATSPTYQFVLTTVNGERYFFNSTIETTKFNSENVCDIENPNSLGYVATAWFVDKIVSATGSTINFAYDLRDYSYIYDYTEFYTYSAFHGVMFPNPPCTEDPFEHSKTSCLRKKDTQTWSLSTVSGDNFDIYFEYVARNDIYNDKLLDKITLMNNMGDLKEVRFHYDEIVATSSFEPGLEQHLENDPWENNALKTRYFLNEAAIFNKAGNLEQSYKFTYDDPSVLPHRFSFSQDLMGCYNGYINGGLVPAEAVRGIGGLNIVLPFANRQSTLAGKAGLLNTIKYPTGGRDSIFYGQNLQTRYQLTEHRSIYTDWFGNETGISYDGAFFTMGVPIPGEIELRIACYHNGEGGPTGVEEEYEATVELWSTDGIMEWPNGTLVKNMRLGEVYIPNNDAFDPPYNGKIFFDPGKEYWLNIHLQGEHTTLEAYMEYVSSVTNDTITGPYMGYHVKKVISQPIIGKNVVKSYNYNKFTKDGDKLNFSNASSIILAPLDNFRVTGVYECCHHTGFPSSHGCIDFPIYRLLSRNNYDMNKFGGLPYAYTNVTEFLDSAQTSFVASEFVVRPNEYSSEVYEPIYHYIQPQSPVLDNSAWDHGKEIRRYFGGKRDDSNYIDRENRWSYSATSNAYYNYSASQLKNIYAGTSDHHYNIGQYAVKVVGLYSNLITLDSIIEINYSREGSGYNTISNKTSYKYNTGDKLVEEEETKGGKGEVLLKQFIRPYKMVALGRDPLGIYQGMVNRHFLSPAIEVVNKRSATQISLARTNYFQPFTGLYVPQSIQTQQAATDPLVTELKYLRYDDKGNVLSLTRDDGSAVNYIWSYKGRYPVAKIDNCDYTTIESTIGATSITNFRGLNPSGANIDVLIAPIRTAVPGAFITRFTYDPLVGMTTVIDPKGQTTYYEYDDFQRLKVIKDHHGNILKSYNYHYSN
ncbi:hypothetical protein GFS24_03605 [Chitinophaga sp. SYP-B3965]|uniref:hypothetical protein n=1 Tax=Chitinophaga sp. SYP-B3965 TaxID=2663120 RepID=UPI0012997DCD|nr:hypothetical protein [Chitinophaga sp. SYP-B3965]MRG44182.1 hypothetical protein [Chitinophaga sp. SYP-B3965]